jgi:hypothetical protein
MAVELRFIVFTVVVTAVASASLFSCLELGRRVGRACRDRDPGTWEAGTGVIDAAVYGLVGLLVAFSFAGASQHFIERRRLIGAEAGAISTALHHVDLLPEKTRPALRRTLRDYIDARVAVHHAAWLGGGTGDENARAKALEHQVWNETLEALRLPGAPPAQVVVPAVDQMFDLADARVFADGLHSPTIVYATLVLIVLLAATLAGYHFAAARRRGLLQIVVYSVAMSAALTMMFDLEFDRVGMTRLSHADAVLIELRDSIPDAGPVSQSP